MHSIYSSRGVFSFLGHRQKWSGQNEFLKPSSGGLQMGHWLCGVKGFQHSFEGTGIACGVFSPNKRAKTLQVFWDQKQKKSSFELGKSLEKGLQTSSNKGNKKHLHWQLQLGVKKHKELWKTTSLSSSIASSTALHQLLCKQHSKGKQIIGTKCIKHGNGFRWHIL